MADRSGLGRRELNKMQTRGDLLAAAKDLFVERGTFTTVEEIADRARVSRATFFNYFPSKDALLGALYDELIVQLGGVVQDLLERDLDTGARIRAVFTDFADNAEGPSRYLLAFTAELDRASTAAQVIERNSQLRQLVVQVLEAGVTVGEVRADYPLDFLGQMVAGIYLAAMHQAWAEGEGRFRRAFELAGAFAAESVCSR